ncbi:MAG TPA: hypothetical protein VFX85_10620 [Solirubrobacterales bacterium]|nr:hypothetical protein [Solirubrobacterales bacterium]
MRDFLLNEALKRLAAEAATRFSTLVASGDQIPFDVSAEDGDDSAFYSYVPLTSRYVEERAEELRTLPSFGPAREAAVEAGVAAPYLESRGESVPADPGARAERMLTTFIASLWEGSTGFSLDRERLESALAMLDAEARDAGDAEILLVPIVGLRMSQARLQLPHGVRIVRADSIEAPIEAMRSEGMGRASWEPQYLAVADQDPEHGAEAALEQLRELISVMRMFKAGGLGLGPYAFAPTGEGCWRRIATGAPATRPGGYRLSEEEADELVALAETLEARPDPDSALTWAVNRFELGCGRESALDGLSDYLLALRAVLEGHGPVGASLPMRAAALIADESVDRIEAREKVEEVLELERELMNGRSLDGAVRLAAWAEEGVRRLLLQAALGELGNDLSATADETLIANGLEAGDAEIAISTDFPEPVAPPEPAEGAKSMEMPVPEFRIEQLQLPPETAEPTAPPEPIEEEFMEQQETRIMEPIPAEDEIKITATPWLEEVSDSRRGDSLEWPAASDRDLQHRERVDTPRVRHLFPVPEDADWEVSHLEFEYNRGSVS